MSSEKDEINGPHSDYEVVTIPDRDIEELLHEVTIKEETYLVGKTGLIYHRDKYIIGKIINWNDEISKDEERDLKIHPVLGYERFFKNKKPLLRMKE